MQFRKLTIPLVLLTLLCSRGGKDIAGTTTETQSGTSAAIEGLIIYGDSMPVHDAAVILHDQSLLKIITLSKREALIRSGNTTTNINGFFRFNSVDTGHYLIEVNDHDTLGGLFSAQVKPKDTLVEVNGVLKRLGCMQGMIDTSLVHGEKSVTVYLPEIGRSVAVDSAGNFQIGFLAGWNYKVEIVANGTVVSTPGDTITIPVTPGDTSIVQSLGAKDGTVKIGGTITEQP
jgi:hypothetical protein